jgi:hypothetical protein
MQQYFTMTFPSAVLRDDPQQSYALLQQIHALLHSKPKPKSIPITDSNIETCDQIESLIHEE